MPRSEPRLRDFIPMTRAEMEARGWDELDVLLITGDAYVDHPAFGVPLLARHLLAQGYRVGIAAQPIFPGSRAHVGLKGPASEAQAVEALRLLGTPRLMVGVGSGVVDSMINNYTANRRKRSDDVYAAGAQGGLRFSQFRLPKFQIQQC